MLLLNYGKSSEQQQENIPAVSFFIFNFSAFVEAFLQQ
jgi:hypothetical protein